MKTLKDFNFKGKRVLTRCDFNVPLNEKGDILDDFRIRQAIPTIKYLIKKGAKVILISHLGRPEGRTLEELELDPAAKRLSRLIKRPVKKLDHCLGGKIKQEILKMKKGELVLLENIRFCGKELKNDDEFSRDLAKLGEIYINDAFAAIHREHSSIAGLPKYLPSGAGFLLEKEIRVLTAVRKHPQKPLVAIIGGKKLEREKLELINNFSAEGCVLLGSLVNEEIKKGKIRLRFPQRVLGPVEEKAGKDISSETIKIFEQKIKKAKTIFWDGPLGKIEEKKYQKGSAAIAQAIIKSGAFSVIGGGQIVGFINKLGLIKKFNHVSTGGGAMLAFLAGRKLPGIEALK